MTEAITDSAGLNGPVSEGPARRKRTASGTTRATKKAAENTPVENVNIGEVVNDDGQKVISGPKRGKTARKSNSFVTEDGAIASRAADAALRSKAAPVDKVEDDKDKVALWSDRNVRWNLIGTLSKGYNIVTKEAAEKWLTQRGIREATPEEVATYYGK